MGLISKKTEITLGNMNIKYFEDLGYEIPKWIDTRNILSVKRGTSIIVKIEDLKRSSNALIDVQCDCCSKILKNVKWGNYLKYVKEDGKYYCKKCAKKLYGDEKTRKTKLKNSKSFEQWCLNNNREDVLSRWDYELNDYLPSEITYGTNKKYYFKCPSGKHESELKFINAFTNGQEGSIDCKACNSFAQWGIDNLGEDFLEKYWDYEKNIISPWEISYGSSKKKVYIICQEKNYHGSYPIFCYCFISDARCGYCNNKKVHSLDSLGKLLEDKGLLYLWSDKNKKSPYEYAPKSRKEVYWKCPEGLHEDYPRNINDSNKLNFRCPECQYSKGEEVISNYFIKKGFIKIDQKDFEQLIDEDKYNKNYYIPQKEFKGLLGLGNGNLSYDFYIPKLNLLIEYQGEQHEHYCKGFHKSKKDFAKQQEHDRRKREYAKYHNIKLLEIWYYDFDNIEEILEKELKY